MSFLWPRTRLAWQWRLEGTVLLWGWHDFQHYLGEHEQMVNVTIMEPGTKFNLEHGGVHTFISVWSEICWGSRASQVSDRVAHQLWVFTMSSRVWYSPFPPTAVFQLSRFSAQTWKRYKSNNQQKSNILELGPILSALLWGDVWCFLPKHERDPLRSRFSSSCSKPLAVRCWGSNRIPTVRKTKWVKWKQRLLGL